MILGLFPKYSYTFDQLDKIQRINTKCLRNRKWLVAAAISENTEIFGKQLRTIIIENISNDFHEESLISIFRQAGAISKFELIDDQETLKFRGMASCEYYHPSMALNAVKMFNNISYNGRQLRVVLKDSVSNSKASEHVSDSVISQAVASLPPDQMYELMKQMKLCIQNNPNEARNMLLQNPQLAYALLQAQIVMKIVDPKVAIAMLNRSLEQIPNTPSSSQQIINQIPSQPYAENTNIRHISVFPDLPPSSNNINNPVCDSYRQMYDLQNPVYSQSRVHAVPVNNSDLDFFNSMQKTMKFEGICETSLFNTQNEDEKAALILQVLRLSDHQIALLPEDQRRSILILKEQLNRA